MLCLLLAACGGPELAPLAPDARILAFGDSLTFGTGAAPDSAYPAVLSELTAHTVVNGGVPGEISEDGLARLPELLEAHSPALVVLVHGGNDALQNLPRDSTERNLDAMVKMSLAAGAQVVMLAVPGRNFTLSAPDFYEVVADNAGIPIDLDTLPSLMRDRSVKSDPVHFNAEGYRRMARAVHVLLSDAGALP
jgi:lysophospholipase L1-like esterase